MEYLYLNFDSNESELVGGGVYTGIKLFLFKATDFPEAAGIQVSGLANTKSNVMNMVSIDGKLNNKGYYIDAKKLNHADLIISTVEFGKRKATTAGFNIALKTVLSFINQENRAKVAKDIKHSLNKLPMSIDIANFDTSKFSDNKDDVVKKLIAYIKSVTKLQLDTAIIVTFGVVSNTVSYVKTFTEQELEQNMTDVAKQDDNINVTI